MRSSKREVPLDGKGKEGGGKSGSKVPISLRNKGKQLEEMFLPFSLFSFSAAAHQKANAAFVRSK